MRCYDAAFAQHPQKQVLASTNLCYWTNKAIVTTKPRGIRVAQSCLPIAPTTNHGRNGTLTALPARAVPASPANYAGLVASRVESSGCMEVKAPLAHGSIRGGKPLDSYPITEGRMGNGPHVCWYEYAAPDKLA